MGTIKKVRVSGSRQLMESCAAKRETWEQYEQERGTIPSTDIEWAVYSAPEGIIDEMRDAGFVVLSQMNEGS